MGHSSDDLLTSGGEAKLAEGLLKPGRVSVRLLKSFLGKAMSTRPAVRLARATTRGIQRQSNLHYNGTSSSLKKLINISNWGKEELQWWINLNLAECSLPLETVPIWNTVRLATDAMDTALGSVLEGRIHYRIFTKEELLHTIAHKEWMAFEETVEANLSTLANKVVTWHVDNQNVKQAWLNLGTIRHHWLCDKSYGYRNSSTNRTQ